MRRMMAITLTACLLYGCSGNSIVRAVDAPRERVDGRFLTDDGYDEFRTVVDSKTGITYLVWMHGGGNNNGVAGITPLLNRDGKPVISEEVAR